MKITFISTNDTVGGAAIVTLRLMEALRAMAERGVALHAERSCPPQTLWAVKNIEG